MIGTVDNGFTAEVVIDRFVAPSAGVRLKGNVATIAFLTKPGFMKSFPRSITVDGVEMTATSARKSDDVKGMLVLTVDWLPAEG